MKYILIFLFSFSVTYGQVPLQQFIGAPEGNVTTRGTHRVINLPHGSIDDSLVTADPTGLLRQIGGIPRTSILDELCIYQEGTEWTPNVETGDGFDPASTTFPCSGNVSIEGTAISNNDVITLTATSVPDYSNFDFLRLEISSKALWVQGDRLRFRFANGGELVGTAVNIGNLSYSFNSAITDSCQLIYIPMAAFGSITTADNLRIVGAVTSGTIGMFIDNICFIKTSTSQVPPTNERQAWWQTMDLDPDLYRDYFSSFHNKDWHIDSAKRLTMHVTDQLRVIGDVESGREVTQTWYVNDNPYTYAYQGNSTASNQIYSPAFGAYLSAYPHPVTNGVLNFKAAIHPLNDITGAEASFNFIAAIANDDTTNAIQPILHQQLNKPIAIFGGVDESTGFTDSMMEIFATGQQQWAHYGVGDFQTSTYSYLLGTNSNGVIVEVLPGDVEGGGGGPEEDSIALSKSTTLAEGYGILSPETNTQLINDNPSYSVAVDTNLITSKPYLYKVTDSIIGLIPPTSGDTNFIRNQYTHREAKDSWHDTAMFQRVRMSSATTPQVMVMEGNGGFLWRRTNSNGSALNISPTGLTNGRIQFSADYTAGSGNGKSPILKIIDTAAVEVFSFGSFGMTFNQNNGSIFRIPSGNPGGGVANTASIYVEDVAASAEMKVRDEAGNQTTITPHDPRGLPGGLKGLEWSYHSERDGKYIAVNMYKAIKQIEKQDAEIEGLKKEIAELKGLIYKKKKPVKLIYTGKVKK